MKNNLKKMSIVVLILIFITGCTTYLKDDNKKNVINPQTGQSLTENILCQPTDEKTIEIYQENGIDISELPYCVCERDTYTKGEYTNGEYTEAEYDCESFSVTSGEYDGLWTSIFVKPLAWVILFFGKLTNNFGVGLILTSILIRLIAYPITRKATFQSESLKKIQPELEKLEKKYAGKDQNDQQVMMMNLE